MRDKNSLSVAVRTSKGVIDSFNRQKIIDSLVSEARVDRGVAEEIAEEIEIEIRPSRRATQ